MPAIPTKTELVGQMMILRQLYKQFLKAKMKVNALFVSFNKIFTI